jgi:hypothetical protein
MVDNDSAYWEDINTDRGFLERIIFRNISYYNWKMYRFKPEPNKGVEFVRTSMTIRDVKKDSKGCIYIAAAQKEAKGSTNQYCGILLRSIDEGKTWKEVDKIVSSNGINTKFCCIKIDINDHIYTGGSKGVTSSKLEWIIRKSTTGLSGSFDTIDGFSRNSGEECVYGIDIDSNGNIYAVGTETIAGADSNWIVRKSTTGLSGSFNYIDSYDLNSSIDVANSISIDSNNNIYVYGRESIRVKYF